MSKKLIYLLVALILPGIIFVFLKMFGRNEFTIPVYYQQGVADVQGTCSGDYKSPYQVPDSIMSRIRSSQMPLPVLVVADSSGSMKRGMIHLQEQIAARDFDLVFSTGSDRPWDQWLACFFFLKKPWSAVLVDSENRIRGYYNPKTREEVDRLAVEMKILLKQY